MGGNERELPANLAAERSLLGAILYNNKSIDQCSGLSPDDFYDIVNGTIFGMCKRRIEAGRMVDGVTLMDALANTLVCDSAYLAGLLTQMVSINYVTSYATAIRDAALRRQEIAIAGQMIERAYRMEQSHGDGAETLSWAMASLEEAGAVHGIGSAVTMADAVEVALTQSEAAYRGDARARGLNTGIPALDEALGGLHDGELTIIGARSGEGKSTLALQIARAVGVPVAVFSMEMSSEAIGLFNLASLSGISADDIRRGRYDLERANDLLEVRTKLAGMPIYIEDQAAILLGEAITRLRALKRQHGIRLAIFDHRDLFGRDPGHERDPELVWYRRVTAGLKAAAKMLAIPIIVLLQMNRGIEAREDKRPRKSDLYGAGEQDADNVMLLFRPELHMGDGPKRGPESEEMYANRRSQWLRELDACRGRCDVFLVKRRFGPPGMVSLAFDGPSLTFR